jgi:membrane protein
VLIGVLRVNFGAVATGTLIWIHYAAQIVLFGAEFTRVYAQERGRGIRPAKHAVRVDRKEIELPPLTDRGDK